MKLLIDECLHTSLTALAHRKGHIADHVDHAGLGGAKDWELLKTVLQQDYTFVTNNRSDFLALYGREQLHAGLIIVVPNVTPLSQRELLAAGLEHIATRDLTNTVVEISYVGSQIKCSEYEWPRRKQSESQA